MSPIGRHQAGAAGKGGNEFTQAMRFELLGEDERPLLTSYAIAAALGGLWLTLVMFGPHPEIQPRPWVVTADPPFGDFRFVPEPAPLDARDATPGGGGAPGARPRGGASTPRPASTASSAAIANAFTNGGPAAIDAARRLAGAIADATLGDPGRVLRNVTGDGGGKVAIAGGGAGGAGGAGSPGRSGAFGGGAGGTTGVGVVGGGGRAGGGVGRAPVVVAEPTVVMATPDIPNARDVADVGQTVRSYAAQLQSCYEREGLRQNPGLAGTVTAAITISGAGRVTGVDVTRRTWSGPGADDAERCIVSTIRRWRFGSAGESEGTYSFPFSFTK